MNRGSVILLCITTLAIFFILKEKPKLDIKKYEDQINALQSEINELEGVNDSLQLQSVELEKTIARYDVVIDNLKDEVNVIQREAQIKIDAVDNFGDDQLESFFAERYITKDNTGNNSNSTSGNQRPNKR